jgi:hypothetical protein
MEGIRRPPRAGPSRGNTGDRSGPLFAGLLRRTMWDEVGGLDEGFKWGPSRTTIFAAHRNAGYRIVTAEDCFIHHFGNGSFAKLESETMLRIFDQNKKRFESNGMSPGVLSDPSWWADFEDNRVAVSEFFRKKPVDLEILKDYVRPYYLKWLYYRIWPSRRASYLTDWWNNPNFPLPARIGDPVPRNPSRPELLFLPMTDWHARIQRSQHLAMTFGGLGTRCFYLNPHLGREFPRPYLPGAAVRMGPVAPQVLELHVHLPREPVYHHRLLTSAETARLVRAR